MPAEQISRPLTPRFALSVDVEDYFQVWAFSSVIDRASWDDYALRVDGVTRRILDLFDRRGAKATFFTLGWIAERAPALVREIVARGHELASHGYDHTKVFDQLPDEFRADVRKTKKILEDCGGVEVKGFRAAGFSIDGRTPWAHEILGETGHAYSSSSHPIAHDHYGDPDAPRAPFKTGGVVEAPVATTQIIGRRVSCAGGGWFRAAPYALSSALIRHASRTLSGPTIFYFHPWEIDVDQPRIDNAPSKSKLRHYLNLGRMEGKLDRLLIDFKWERIDESLGLRPVKDEAA
jgi:polysaccharide deacetylase family protein (PEP-CTERM system associated)